MNLLKKTYSLIIGILVIFGIYGCSEDPLPPAEKPVQVDLIKSYTVGVGQDKITVVGSLDLGFISAFFSKLGEQELNLTTVQGDFPFILKDQNGRYFDLFGKSKDGLVQLQVPIASFGYWFAWSSMYPGIQVYGEPPTDKVRIDFVKKNGWCIPEEFIFTGANFDAIQGLTYPEFVTYDQKDEIKNGFYLKTTDRVIVLPEGENQIRVYPHNILNYHEIVNDRVGISELAIIFSPFTGTATVWDRSFDNRIHTFGSSGRIFNSNIMPFDRSTRSDWSQLLGRAVRGNYLGFEPKRIPYFEADWGKVKELYDNILVLSPDTGFPDDYTLYPFEDYRTNHDYLYSPDMQYVDGRFKRKEFFFGVTNGADAMVFKLSEF